MASHESRAPEIDAVIHPTDPSDIRSDSHHSNSSGSECSDIVLLSCSGCLPIEWNEPLPIGQSEQITSITSATDGSADGEPCIGSSHHLSHTGEMGSGDGDEFEFESQDDIESMGNTPVVATIQSRISRSPPPMPGLPEMALALVPYDPVPDGDAAAGPPPPMPLFTSTSDEGDANMDDGSEVGEGGTGDNDDDSSGITYIDHSYGFRHTGFGHTGVGAHSCTHCKIVGQCIMCGYLFRAYPGGWQSLHFARDNHNDERPTRRPRLV